MTSHLGYHDITLGEPSEGTLLNVHTLKDRFNYSKPTWGLARFHFTYPWFKTLHFAHLKLVPLAFRNPPLRLPLEKYIFKKKQI